MAGTRDAYVEKAEGYAKALESIAIGVDAHLFL
jgi:hypothetical protein